MRRPYLNISIIQLNSQKSKNYKFHNMSWSLFYVIKLYIAENVFFPKRVVPITTKVVSSNLVHGEVYSIQHCVIKFVNALRQVGGFIHQSN